MPRPRFETNEEQRRLVKNFSACGVSQEQIARRLGIRSAKTLRKHFREELDRGSLDANTSVAQTLYKMATSGNHPAATFFWLKTRAGWRERAQFEAAPGLPPPFLVAREERSDDPA
jgi:transposase